MGPIKTLFLMLGLVSHLPLVPWDVGDLNVAVPMSKCHRHPLKSGSESEGNTSKLAEI